MKILVLGGDGMLGHQLVLTLSETHTVACTLRRDLSSYQHFGIFNSGNSLTGLDAFDPAAMMRAQNVT